MKFIVLVLTLNGAHYTSYSQTHASEEYEPLKNWLKNSWLNTSLKYDTAVQASAKIIVYLDFECSADCSAQWENLKTSFENKATMPFEKYLFEKVAFLLNIMPSDVVLKLANHPNDYSPPCFTRRIEFNDSLEIEQANCKDVISSTSVNKRSINPVFFEQKTNLHISDEGIEKIKDSLYQHVYQYFKKLNPACSIYKTRALDINSISFIVENLKNEVIPRGALNFKSIEILQFIIDCVPHNEYVTLNLRLNGRYGSDVMRPWNLNGYNDMEIMYKAELQKYADVFTNDKIPLWLKN